MGTQSGRWLRDYSRGIGSGVPMGDCNQFGYMLWEQWGHCDTGDCHDNGCYPYKVFVEVPPHQGAAGTSHYGNCGGNGKGWG